ncbi:MAG TPA: hypothetical protein VFX86_02690 [Candidatus Saccharimonadales bacterium]|nr:hypothetical protein [Candidatus Saccharimonadales bacterium]
MANKRIFWVFIALTVIYIMEVLLIPPDSSALAKFRLSETEAKLLALTFALPIAFVWMLGSYVYIKFKSYVDSISNYKDGRIFSTISTGVLLLCLWLPISTIVSNLSNYAYRVQPSWTMPLVIINNYLNLLLVLAALLLIYKGASELSSLKEAKKASGWKYLALIPIIAISEFYIFLTLNNPARQFPTEDVKTAGYYMPDWLIIGTVVIPYILVFYYGFFAVLNLYIYRRKVRGIIYKSALDYFAKGLFCIVTSIVFIRYLASSSSAFSDSTLKTILLIIYLLLVILLLGFVLMVKSVKKLEKIEKV